LYFEAPDSNLSPDTDYPEDFVVLVTPSMQTPRYVSN